MEFQAKDIAALLSGSVEGDPEVAVNNVSKIEEGKPGTLAFLANPKYEHYIYTTGASIVLVNEDFKPAHPCPCTLIRVKSAYDAIATLLQMYESMKPKPAGIEQPSYVSKTATVGDDTVIYSGVKVYAGCVIGKGCILHSGAVIGADGFGFVPEGDYYKKIPQIGNVVLEDNVEIGANTCIDRATMGSTRIHDGVKLDNLIQIAHNVVIGRNTVIAAQSGVAGTAKVGENCVFGGQVGIIGHLEIGNGTQIAAQSGITNSVKEKSVLRGSPAFDLPYYQKCYVVFRKLPELYSQLRDLQKEVKELKMK